MLGIWMVIGFFFVLMLLDSSSSDTDDSCAGTASPAYDDQTDKDTQDEEEDETEEETSLSDKLESVWLFCGMMEAADREYRMNHAQCGKCRNCRYSHDEERDGFLTTSRHEIYVCSWTGEEIDAIDLYDERVCSYFEMK